jgi:hypothetical protein
MPEPWRRCHCRRIWATADMASVWVLPESGATRKVFDCREDAVIRTSEETDWNRGNPEERPPGAQN